MLPISDYSGILLDETQYFANKILYAEIFNYFEIQNSLLQKCS